MGTQLVLSSAKRLFFNLCNALNPKPNPQTIRIFSPYRNISLFSLVFILKVPLNQVSSDSSDLCTDRIQFFIDMLIPPVDLVDIMNCTDSLSR